jgi:hypothetical protein
MLGLGYQVFGLGAKQLHLQVVNGSLSKDIVARSSADFGLQMEEYRSHLLTVLEP